MLKKELNVALFCVQNLFSFPVEMSTRKLLEISVDPNGESCGNTTPPNVSTNTTENRRPPPWTNYQNVDAKTCTYIRRVKGLEQIINKINNGERVLILLRGLPGSGKSFLARIIVNITVGMENYKNHVFSSDDYFMQGERYVFDGSRLKDADEFKQLRALSATSKGFSPIIIDGTNIELSHMQPYAQMAVDYGYNLEILEPETPWKYKVSQLAEKNTHGVSKTSIAAMLGRFYGSITGSDLIQTYNLKYIKSPPVLRNYPPIGHNPVSSFSCNDLSYAVTALSGSALCSSMPALNNNEPAETTNLMGFDNFNEMPRTPNSDIIEILDDDDSVNIVDTICPPANEKVILKPTKVNTNAPSSSTNHSIM